MIEVVEPWCQSSGSFCVAGEDLPGRPLDLKGAVEAFIPSVLLRAVRADEHVAGAEFGDHVSDGA